MLTIDALTYQIGSRVLFDEASVQIGDGRKIGIVGRNGAGKSTLLSLLLGELTPDRGDIDLAARRRIGSVAQQAPDGDAALIEVVLAADEERTSLLTRLENNPPPEELGEIHARLNDIDAHAAPSRAASILAGLGFDDAAQKRAVREFSGGWKMRVALAAALFSQPDYLLLDEPTNHLDMEASLWLEAYLARYRGGLLLVSHDRGLLNRVPDAILHLDQKKLTLYAGGYDRFEKTRAERQARQAALYSKQQDQRRHIQAFVDRFRAKATKARQAQSRLKMLERMEPIAAAVEERGVTFRLPKPDPLSPPLITLEDISVGYEDAKPILKGINLRIDMDDRIALLGVNGAGKTTLLRLLARRLKPSEGQYRASSKLEIGYFAQNQLEELNPAASAVEHLQALSPLATEQSIRDHLGSFSFEQQKADTKIANLSGGEKARLALATICRKRPHILFLDEPTNHLDIDSRQALIQALADYEGAVILVSHDPHIVAATADRLLIVGNQGCTGFDGDIDDYRSLINETQKAARRASKSTANQSYAMDQNASEPSKKEDRKQRAEARAALAPLKKTIQALEKKLARLSTERDKIHAELAALAAQDAASQDATAIVSLTKKAATIETEIETVEEEWLGASEDLEQAEQP